MWTNLQIFLTIKFPRKKSENQVTFATVISNKFVMHKRPSKGIRDYNEWNIRCLVFYIQTHCIWRNCTSYGNKFVSEATVSRIWASSCNTALSLGRIHTGTSWLSSALRYRQHSIGYMGDGFYRSKDPTNSINVLKEKATKENQKTQTHIHTQ